MPTNPVEIESDLVGITLRIFVSMVGIGMSTVVVAYAWTELPVSTPEDRKKLIAAISSRSAIIAKMAVTGAKGLIHDYIKDQVK